MSTLGTYQYNGLHWRTSKQFPHSGNTEERQLFYSASWQLLEERIDSDNSGGFAEEKCAQTVWGLRYTDDAVLRRTDNDQDYNYGDSGERCDYCLTDPQFSVVAVVSDAGALQERTAYSAYGEARHHFPADMDADGDVDSTDIGWFTSANFKDIDEAGYNPDGDLNRDGTVNSSDLMLTFAWYGKAALIKGLISDPAGPDSPIGYDGYVFNAETKLYTVRFRHYEPVTGRWMERDPLGYVDGGSTYLCALANPLRYADRLGAAAEDGSEFFPPTPFIAPGFVHWLWHEMGCDAMAREIMKLRKRASVYNQNASDLEDATLLDDASQCVAAAHALKEWLSWAGLAGAGGKVIKSWKEGGDQLRKRIDDGSTGDELLDKLFDGPLSDAEWQELAERLGFTALGASADVLLWEVLLDPSGATLDALVDLASADWAAMEGQCEVQCTFARAFADVLSDKAAKLTDEYRKYGCGDDPHRRVLFDLGASAR